MTQLLDTLVGELGKLAEAEHISGHLEPTALLISELEKLLANDEFDTAHTLTRQWEDSLRANLKASNSSLNKLNKNALEKVDPITEDVYLYKLPKDESTLRLLDNAIKLHLLREGDLGLDIGRSDLMLQFQEKNRIMRSLQQGDLSSVLTWVDEFASGTELEFMVHRLQFVNYYTKGQVYDAFRYAQQWFPKLLSKDDSNLKDTSKLMTSLLFDHADSQSPYHSITQLTPSSIAELGMLFTKQFCSHIGFSFESTLSTIILSAHIALPYFDKFQRIRASTNLDWTSSDELPFEVPLPEALKFHAIYICPVTKCETTVDNPAMALPCHHVISKQAMWKLSKNGSNFKCPYCPVTALPTQCRQVQFHII